MNRSDKISSSIGAGPCDRSHEQYSHSALAYFSLSSSHRLSLPKTVRAQQIVRETWCACRACSARSAWNGAAISTASARVHARSARAVFARQRRRAAAADKEFPSLGPEGHAARDGSVKSSRTSAVVVGFGAPMESANGCPHRSGKPFEFRARRYAGLTG